MNIPRMLVTGFVVIAAHCTLGCDSWYFQYQTMDVRVTSLESGDVVPDAQVTALAAEHYRPLRGQTPEEMMAAIAADGANTDDADDEGIARMYVNTTLHRGGLFEHLFDRREPLSDEMTGREFVFRVATDDTAEILSGAIETGERIAGQIFAVEILDVGPPTQGHAREAARR